MEPCRPGTVPFGIMSERVSQTRTFDVQFSVVSRRDPGLFLPFHQSIQQAVVDARVSRLGD